MDKNILKGVIADNQLEVPRYKVIPRDFTFEEFGNYVFVGIRRAGKSYLLYQRMQQLLAQGVQWDEMLYINFEDERLTGMKAEDLNLLLEVHLEMYGKKPILFLDEMHTIIGAGGAEGAIDASNILKPSLARGELQLIGATTVAEYHKYVEKDAALERRFQSVMVEEPTVQEAERILKGIVHKYEEHHKVVITEEAVRAAVELSERYINDRNLPDKAIDLIDEASAAVRLKATHVPEKLKKMQEPKLKII